ncbi:hypothetical protein ES703_122446 [subsurface metagenome]
MKYLRVRVCVVCVGLPGMYGSDKRDNIFGSAHTPKTPINKHREYFTNFTG